MLNKEVAQSCHGILTCTEVYSEEVILEIVDQMEMAVIHNAEQGGGSILLWNFDVYRSVQ